MQGKLKRPLANALFIQNINPLKQKKPEQTDHGDLIVGGGEEVKLGAEASPRVSHITVNDKTFAEAQQDQFKIQIEKGGKISSHGGAGSGSSRPNSGASKSRQLLAKKLADRQPTE